MFSVKVRGRQKATITINESGKYVLDVSRRVKVSTHRNTFKDWEILISYLDWLFDGKYVITDSE